ncbi:MAG: transposase [Proteobacteria bacterium]|nr:transposase [Pseudomonadota bacterium]
MIKIKNHKQMEFFDPWDFLSPKRRQLLDNSWAGLFQKEILCELPVSKLASIFHETFGRPTKELHTVLGVLILQQTHDLTDEETVNQLAFNIQWHYALNITEESDSAKYMCPKTLWSMRNTVIEGELYDISFEAITEKLSRVFNVDTDKQRIDSVHIKSNMKRLGRINIFATTIRKFLTNLKRNYKDLYDNIDEELTSKYISDKAFQCFSMVKPSESTKTLNSVSADLFDFCEMFKTSPQVKQMTSFKLMKRVLNEQCNIVESEKGKEVEVKKPKEILSSSLQNPSDPDATFSGHKGQGYQVQVMETYTDTEDKDEKKKTLNLITHVEVEKACQSDAHALKPAVTSAQKKGLCPKELLADSLYGGDDNVLYAKSKGVELISPTMGSIKSEEINLGDFEFSSSGHVNMCPQQIKPLVNTKKKTRYSQGFSPEVCSQCPAVANCPVKPGKKYFYLRYTEKEMRIAKRRAEEKTPEFKDRYRWRSGVEATMSEYSTRTGVKKLRVRGFKMVRFCAILKAIGVNIYRATAVRKAESRLNGPPGSLIFLILYLVLIFKEQIKNKYKAILQKCYQIPINYKIVYS